MRCEVLFGNKVLSPNHAGIYETGAAIDNRDMACSDARLSIVVSSQTWQQEEWNLTSVHFREHFTTNPIIQDGRRILWRPVEACYIGGDENPKFRLELENDKQSDPFRYSLCMKSGTVEKHFPCRAGTYKYVLWLTGRKNLFDEPRDLRLLDGEISVEDPPEDRFAGKHIILTRAYYNDPQSKVDVSAKMKRDGALIDEIRYEGIREEDGRAVHEYSGYMYFWRAEGWTRFSDRETTLYEKTNPVFFTVEDNAYVAVYLEDHASLMLNIKSAQQSPQYGGVQIFSRKNELTQEEQNLYLAFADKFKYMERSN